jgi:hypothetical protein
LYHSGQHFDDFEMNFLHDGVCQYATKTLKRVVGGGLPNGVRGSVGAFVYWFGDDREQVATVTNVLGWVGWVVFVQPGRVQNGERRF